MRACRFVVLIVLLSGVVSTALTVPTPASAAEIARQAKEAAFAAAESAIFTPASKPSPAFVPRTDFKKKWTPSLGGRFGSATTSTPVSRSAKATVSPNVAPAGTTAGAPGVGELPWFSFEKFPLTTTSVAQVNLANGNLLLKSTDATLAAPGFGFRQDRFYNGLSTNWGTLGGGWDYNSSTNQIGLGLGSGVADFFGPNGTIVRFSGSGSTFTAPAGSNMTLTKIGSGTFAYVVTLNRSGERWVFDQVGRLSGTQDRNGVGEYYALSTGQVYTVSAWGSNRANTQASWGYNFSQNSPTENPTDLEDSAGRTVQYGYDGSSRLSTVTAMDGAVTTYAYDPNGRIATITQPSAGTTGGTSTVAFGYDSQSRVTTVTQQNASTTWGAVANSVTTFAYSAGLTTQTDANGNVAKYTIDSSGRVTKTTDGRGYSRSQTWTANSDVATSTDALTVGNVTTYQFDGNNNATKATLPSGAAATASYAVGGSCAVASSGTAYQPKCSTDAAGNRSSYQYDAVGNLTQQSDTTPATPTVTRTYSYENASSSLCNGIVGQVCSSTDGNGSATTNHYDVNGNLDKVTPPAPLGATSYAYDALGRVTSITDGTGQVTGYAYDSADRPVKTTYADGSTVVTAYYANGLTKSITDSLGGTQTYQYDTRGNITAQTGPGTSTAKYTYDKTGNLTSQQDAQGTVNYGYDAANNLTSVRDPGGSCPASISTPAPSGSGCVRMTYDQNEQPVARLLPGGAVVTTTRDTSSRPTRITAKDSGGVVRSDIGYGYSKAGVDQDGIQTRTSFVEQGIPAGAVTTYGYDSRSRLTSAIETTAGTRNASWNWTYDGAGNRLSQVRSGNTGQSPGTIAYAYNAASQLTSTSIDTGAWGYDGNGAQIANGKSGQSVVMTNRLAVSQINGIAQQYFGDGNTVRTHSGTTTFTNAPLGITSSLNGSTTSRFVRTPTGGLIDYRTTATFYYALDAIGSVSGLFDATGAWMGGYSYSPFGDVRATGTSSWVTSNPYRFAGGYRDGNGLYKLGARYYDPTLGRFTQPDPSGQEDNPYSYARSNPINWADQSGYNAAAQIVGLAMAVLTAFICAALPLVGCVAFGALFGALAGGINAAAEALDRGESSAAARGAFLEGAFWGGIGGAITGLAGGLALRVVSALRAAR